jgi:HAD superfamily hydrolase (TIGR01509 family)
MIDLVIFDCDGVLVDSERITNGIFAEMLGAIGLPVTLETVLDWFLGRSMTDCLARIQAELGRPVPDDFLPSYRERCRQALESQLLPVRGVVETIDRLSMPYCVASSGDHDKMRTTLGITGLLPRFEGRLFSAADVARGKPAPDVFLWAATQMGADPSRTVVVEDTEVGVRAGVAARMTVFGYAEFADPDRLRQAGAARVFSKMSRLPELLDELARERSRS